MFFVLAILLHTIFIAVAGKFGPLNDTKGVVIKTKEDLLITVRILRIG